MKILFLGEPASPNTMNWIGALRSLGCEVILASVRPNGDSEVLPIGLDCLPPRLRILIGAGDVKKIITCLKPDLLLAYRVTSYGFLAAMTGFKPLVLAAQNEQIVYLPKPSLSRKFLLGLFARYAIKRADLIHSWSENITDGLSRFGADPSKILTLHRGIDVQAFLEVAEKRRDKIGAFENSPVFVSTRSLFPEYKIDLLLKCFSHLLATYPNAILNIIGDGPDKKRLLDLSVELGMERNVIFHGRLNRDNLLVILSKSLIYISLIATEGMSSSLLEAVTAGLVPIVADMPASKLVVTDGVNGLLLKNPDDDSAVVAAMVESCEKHDEMFEALMENSVGISSRFDVVMNQEKFLERYDELVAKIAIGQQN